MTEVATEPLTVELTVNGRKSERRVEPRISLADFLRDELQLTGTKLGCEHGVCGACTVLVDGAAVRSCLMLAVQAGGRDVKTVEGSDRVPSSHRCRTRFIVITRSSAASALPAC